MCAADAVVVVAGLRDGGLATGGDVATERQRPEPTDGRLVAVKRRRRRAVSAAGEILHTHDNQPKTL